MNIGANIQEIKSVLPSGVRLVAISKTKTADDIMEAYRAGQRLFGENKVQELTAKYEQLPKDIEWHLVGHLQSNKVKYIASFVSLIHSVDSLGLLAEINKQAAKNNRIIKCLLQLHIAQEETKFGLSEDEIIDLLNNPQLADLKNIEIAGLMGMATYTDNETQIRNEFRQLKSLFDKLKRDKFANNSGFAEISMGMSSDFRIAAEQGSTLVRVGSIIFGERIYLPK